MRRSRIFSSGLALAFLPGTCTMLDVGIGSSPVDGFAPIKSFQLFLVTGDPKEEEQEDPPSDTGNPT